MDNFILESAWRRMIDGIERLQKTAIYYRGLLSNRYGESMTAERYKETLRERERLAAIIDVLTDYLEASGTRLPPPKEKGFSFVGEANAALDELIKKL